MKMSNEEYARYLQSDKWKRIQEQRLKIDNFKCAGCGSCGCPSNPLEIHHLSYRYLGEEEGRIFEDLVCLCRACHLHIHKVMERTTSPDGRKGWLNNSRIPQVHVYNLGTYLKHIEE